MRIILLVIVGAFMVPILLALAPVFWWLVVAEPEPKARRAKVAETLQPQGMSVEGGEVPAL